ncbi:hypothetical protein [Polaromonas sp.]|uniref:hypothetical protein n=1 Tax=Polaromonas sp. TaxID=1869339 RepID=UPI003563AB05
MLTIPVSRATRAVFVAAGLAGLMALAACNPTFNWREVRPDNTPLSLLLPCKPDKAEKSVALAGQLAQLQMQGCDAGGATFAVAVATLADVSRAQAALAEWQQLTLVNMKAGPVGTGAGGTQVVPFRPSGMVAGPPALMVKAQGSRVDGRAVAGHAAYFSRGAQLFQVVLYADTINAEVAETFFSSLKFEPVP